MSRISGMSAAGVFVAVFVFAMLCGPAAQAGAANDNAPWQPVGLSGGGGLFNPVVSPHDPNLWLTESDMGGRYISHDGGHTWSMIHFQQIGAACRGANPLFHPTKPGVIYALSGYGANALHLSTDNGVTWKILPNDRQPNAGLISCMFIDLDRPDRMFVGTDSGKIVFTDNDGKTWQAATGVTGFVWRMGVDRQSPKTARVLFAGTPDGVFRSDDGGKTFAKKSTGLPPDKPSRGFASGSNAAGTVLYTIAPCWVEDGKLQGGMYVSKDKGESWQRVMNPNIDVSTKRTDPWGRGDLPEYSHVVANDANPNRAYVYCCGTSYMPPNHSTVYRTDDAGKTWTAVWYVDPRMKQRNVGDDWMTSFMGQSWVGGPIDMEISPTDPDTMQRSDGMFLFITNNAGKSWFPAYTINAMVFTTTVRADRDITWRCNGLVNTTTWHYYVDPHEPSRHYIAYTDIGFARSLDRGVTWRWWGPGPPEAEDRNAFPIPREWTNTTYEIAFDPDVPGRIWGAFSGHHDIPNENSIWRGTGPSRGTGGIATSADFGVTWQITMKGLPAAPMLSIILDPKSPKDKRTLYAAVYDHGVFKTADGGANWVEKSKGLGDPANTRVVRVQLHRDGTLFALITGMRIPADGQLTDKGVGLYRSTDAAESWEKVTGRFLYPRDFGVDPENSKVIYIGASDLAALRGQPVPPPQGGLHRTADGGKTWELAVRKRATHFGAYFHPNRKGWIYATCCGWADAPEGSLFLSKDAGKTWAPFKRLPFAQISRVDFDHTDPGVIYVATFGGSVWKGPAEPEKE